MSAVAVDICPDILRWILRKHPNAGGRDIFKKLEKWISGEKKPTFSQIEKLSNKTNIPFGFFFFPSRPMRKTLLLISAPSGALASQTLAVT